MCYSVCGKRHKPSRFLSVVRDYKYRPHSPSLGDQHGYSENLPTRQNDIVQM